MEELNNHIDYTLLRQDVTSAEIEAHCARAVENGYYSVIVQPRHVAFVRKCLLGSEVKTGTVAGFPFGEQLTENKVGEAISVVCAGAQEVDMVMAISALKDGDIAYVEADIGAVCKAVKVPVKVILETILLSREEIIEACGCCIRAGASFVKTSTGYFGQGATIENVRLMKSVCQDQIKIKAAGGIKTREIAQALLEAGADRIGASALL